MKYGPIVAERFKKQYFKKRGGWEEYPDWDIRPEQVHLILLELESKAAINALIGNSWTKSIPKTKTKASN